MASNGAFERGDFRHIELQNTSNLHSTRKSQPQCFYKVPISAVKQPARKPAMARFQEMLSSILIEGAGLCTPLR
eukprot:6212621-Pleurochrysis_carterae.AAC.1